MNNFDKIITFDGTSASGKGAIASRIAAHYGYKYLDTGKLYRALAFLIINQNLEDVFERYLPDLLKKLTPDILLKSELLEDRIGNYAAIIAIDSKVRRALFDFQRNFVLENDGSVLDGRDTGSVICPEAKFKFYIDAPLQIRASRRYLQNKFYYDSSGISIDQIAESLAKRDKQDKERKLAPLIIPKNAIILDNGKDSLEEIVKKIIGQLTIGNN